MRKVCSRSSVRMMNLPIKTISFYIRYFSITSTSVLLLLPTILWGVFGEIIHTTVSRRYIIYYNIIVEKQSVVGESNIDWNHWFEYNTNAVGCKITYFIIFTCIYEIIGHISPILFEYFKSKQYQQWLNWNYEVC